MRELSMDSWRKLFWEKIDKAHLRDQWDLKMHQDLGYDCSAPGWVQSVEEHARARWEDRLPISLALAGEGVVRVGVSVQGTVPGWEGASEAPTCKDTSLLAATAAPHQPHTCCFCSGPGCQGIPGCCQILSRVLQGEEISS